MYRSCVGNQHGLYWEANHGSGLEGSNPSFEKLANSYGAHAIGVGDSHLSGDGVQDGNDSEGGVHCIVIELPFCYWN